MSCTYSNTMDNSEGSHDRHYDRRCKGHWSCSNIAAMVIGFVLFWPVGLLILAWTLSGRPVQTLPGAIKKQWRDFRSGHREHRGQASSTSENVVFDEYQETQYDRIRELKDEIKERARRFSQFRENARRNADQAEFDEFMSSTPASDSNG